MAEEVTTQVTSTNQPASETAAAPATTTDSQSTLTTPPAEAPPAAETATVESTQKPEEVKPVVPEKYDLKLSEGSLLKPAHVEQVSAYAKQNGLTQAQAEGLLAREESAVKSYHENAVSQRNEQINQWREQSMKDTEFGGENLNANAEYARRAVVKYGGESLKKILDETGYGDHPEIIRTFYRIGKAMSDGQIVSGGTTANQVSIEDKFYPNHNKN